MPIFSSSFIASSISTLRLLTSKSFEAINIVLSILTTILSQVPRSLTCMFSISPSSSPQYLPPVAAAISSITISLRIILSGGMITQTEILPFILLAHKAFIGLSSISPIISMPFPLDIAGVSKCSILAIVIIFLPQSRIYGFSITHSPRTESVTKYLLLQPRAILIPWITST